MAPSPVVDIKPKGPDKNTEKCVDGVSLNSKQSMSKNDYGSNSKDKTSVDSLGNINEKELKSLLDEAYSYKNPKDRLNKSPLFKNLLNEVEQDDISKKKRIDQNHSFIDGLTAPPFIQNEHNSVSNRDFRNILGCCEKEKKNKKSGKRDASSSNSSRRKFTHNLNINSGSQSSSVYNGNVGGANSFHSNSRSLSRSSQLARSQQPFSSRLANTKAAAVLTSSSNIDKPMVTTYNKQPIMTPALAPTTQQKTPTELIMSSLSKSNNEIEMKILNAKNEDSVHNYTTHAVLEINGGGNSYGSTDVGANVGQHDLNGKCKPSTNDTLVEFSLPRSSGTLVNGIEGTSSVKSAVTSDTVNGLFVNAEDVENANAINEYDEEKQLKKKNKKKTVSSVSSADGVVDGTSSVDESKTRSSLPEKDEQNMAWVTNPTLHSYSLTWNNVTFPSLYLFGDPTGRGIYSKESESKKLNNDSCTLTKDGAASGFKDRTDDRKHKGRKTKQQKPDVASYKSESIAGHCGDKSISYLLEYIENDHSNGSGVTGSVGQKSTKTKTASSNMASKHEKQLKGKACTDEDIRNKKPSKAKERLKKSSSLEDLRHNRAKSNKKQSSVDESHYTKTEDEENENATEDNYTTAVNRTQMTPNITAVSHVIASVTETEFHMPVDEETRLCLDSLINDDNYTETEFRLVTKKQRRKKLSKSTSRTTDQKVVGESSSLSHGFLPHPYSDRNEGGGFKRSTRGNENRHRSRRKSVSSVIPSDKISDSDSIHSLPVSSTTPKCKIKKKSTSSGCTPQASYADIAKSPQCQSSMALSGEPTSTVAADKWEVKSFSNASASSNTRGLAATSVSLNLTSSCSTAVLSEHSHNSELVSSTTCGNHVELDDGCDQLLLTNSNNNISNNSAGSGSPSSVNNIDEGNITTNNSNNNSSVNLNNAGNYDNDVNNSDVTRIDVTLRRKSKTNNKSNSSENGDDNNNNNNYTCCNAKSEKSMSSLNASTITNGTKVKKSKNRKKTQGDELDVVTNCSNMSSNNVCSKQDNDLFVEFTLKCTPPAVVTTKCSETQTDLVEVNNNAFCNNVTVEETVILKSSRGSLDSSNIGIWNSETKGEKFSKTSLPIDETGSRIVVLPHDEGSENVVSVGFDVNAQLLEDAVVVQEKRTALLKEVRERSTKYNVSEVIQYVHKSWNEVMDTLSSTKITDAKPKIQYYVAK